MDYIFTACFKLIKILKRASQLAFHSRGQIFVDLLHFIYSVLFFSLQSHYCSFQWDVGIQYLRTLQDMDEQVTVQFCLVLVSSKNVLIIVHKR